MHAPTAQQQAIYDAVATGDSHILVGALAGTGKTTTAVQAAKAAPRGSRIGFVAFNKHIARELQSRLGTSAAASTLHSLGYAAVRRRFPDVQLDERKPTVLLQHLRPEWFWTTARGAVKPRDEAQAVLALARLCKCTLADDDNLSLHEMAEHYGVDLDSRTTIADLFDATRLLVQACAENTETIDFDDMVWLPVRLGWQFGGFDLLLVDESQDLNRAQQALARAACDGGRMVVIGDKHQAIYGFTGSDAESIDNLSSDLTATTRSLVTCPLTVTWRCPRSHVALAQRIVPDLQAAPNAIEGEVHEIGPDDVPLFCSPGALVICRKNAPLVGLAMQLIARGVPAQMRGRDIGKGLLDLIDRLRPREIFDLFCSLNDYLERETERLERKQAPASMLESVEDRVGCLSAIAAQCRTVQELREFIANLFTEPEGGQESGYVWLSSVHRAKGLEAKRVVIVELECLPMIRRDSKPWEHRQELNLLYVALTRSKRELVFAGAMPEMLQ